MRVSVKVWDPFLRLFHWALVVSFAVAWVSAESLETLHNWAGYAAGALIVFRLAWGLVGPKYARFSRFAPSPRKTAQYLKDMAAGREKRYLGHNPAGAVMIFALLAAMGVTVTCGWLLTVGGAGGSEWLEGLHEGAANLLLVLVLLHICGVMFSSVRHKENLAKAMWSGRKRAPAPGDVH